MDEPRQGDITTQMWPQSASPVVESASPHPKVVVAAAFTLVTGLIVAVLGLAGVIKGAHESNPNAISACYADAKTIETVVCAYDAQMTTAVAKEVVGTATGQITLGKPSTHGRSSQARRFIDLGYLTRWPPPNNGYAISLSPTTAGNVSIYVPANSTHPVDFETESATAGCNSL